MMLNPQELLPDADTGEALVAQTLQDDGVEALRQVPPLSFDSKLS